MSNKTQLQTNNSSLDALITRVTSAKDVAASLPDAGSGGSGGEGIELCTVEIICDAPVPSCDIAWFDENGNFQKAYFSGTDIMMGLSFTVPKYSAIAAPKALFMNHAGTVYENFQVALSGFALFVKGSGTFVIT